MTGLAVSIADEQRPSNDGWAERLAKMEEWYRDLLRDGFEPAEAELEFWFAPHAEYLAQLTGRVIDVGGGVGLIGRYLDPACEHVVVDPAGFWHLPQWREFGARFAPGHSPAFVEGRGEALPFADASFDAGINYSSLNHVDRADLCMAELARVVRPGGPVLLVLEDMEPSWSDVLRHIRQRLARRLGLRGAKPPMWWHSASIWGLKDTLSHKLSGKPWPLEPDHTRIRERDLRRWLAPSFKLVRREWRGQLLTFELIRLNP